MVTKYLEVRNGKAVSNCIFEQYNIRGCSVRTLIAIPKEENCSSVRTRNALLIAQRCLQKRIQNDVDVLDKCYTSVRGWRYDEH